MTTAKELLAVNTGLRHTEEVGESEVRWIWPQDLAAAVGQAFHIAND